MAETDEPKSSDGTFVADFPIQAGLEALKDQVAHLEKTVVHLDARVDLALAKIAQAEAPAPSALTTEWRDRLQKLEAEATCRKEGHDWGETVKIEQFLGDRGQKVSFRLTWTCKNCEHREQMIYYRWGQPEFAADLWKSLSNGPPGGRTNP